MEQNLFGQILLNFKLVSEEQLEKCLDIQKKQSPPKMLGEILVEQGLINTKQLNTILSVQRRNLDLSRGRLKTSESEIQDRLKGAPLSEYLKVAKELGASDLYITSDVPPAIRLHGNLVDLPAQPLTFDGSKNLILSVLSKQENDEYYKSKFVEFPLEVPGIGRFRTSVFRHLKGIAGVFRIVLDEIWPFQQLDLPAIVKEFTMMSRGLVLITGPGGSGKSTTLYSLVDMINHTQKVHIIAIEDLIEVVMKSDKAFISQRQVPRDSNSFRTALRAALREDPDVIVVGEMRDPETVATAITAAETGHLIFGTLHTQNAQRTVLRILDLYPAEKRAYIRTLLAGVLKGVVSQQLVPNLDGKGRSLASEIMIVNPAISNLIREDRAWQIPTVIQTGAAQGMRLMDDSLLELVRKRKIAVEEGLSRAVDRTKFLKPT